MGTTPWGRIERKAPAHHGPRFGRLALFGAAAACLLLIRNGHVWASLGVAATVLGITQASRLSPRLAGEAESTLAGFARATSHAVGAGLSWLLLSLAYVLVFVPLAAVTAVFRRRPREARRDGWVPRVQPVPPGSRRRTFGAEPLRAPAARTSPLLKVIAVVVSVAVIDVAAGAILAGSGVLPGTRGEIRTSITEGIQATMSAAPVGAEPWASQFGQDLAAFELQEPTYVPFVLRDFGEFHGTDLNTTDEERVSYQPTSGEGVEPLHVAFLGGSAMFGVGQRDGHTIPSEFARIAEARGIPLDVHNYGFPGWVSWQEFLYLERLLAAGRRYDLIVVFDGFNDFLVQTNQISRDPTHFGVGAIQGLLSEFHREHDVEPGFLDGVNELVKAYQRNSAIARFIDHLDGEATDPPGVVADEAADPGRQADATVAIHRRAQRRISDLADDDRTPVHFFWQPQRGGWPTRVTSRLSPNVSDLSDVFAGREDDLYLDEVHTNEEGARIVAEAMWAELGPGLEDQSGFRTRGTA